MLAATCSHQGGEHSRQSKRNCLLQFVIGYTKQHPLASWVLGWRPETCVDEQECVSAGGRKPVPH